MHLCPSESSDDGSSSRSTGGGSSRGLVVVDGSDSSEESSDEPASSAVEATPVPSSEATLTQEDEPVIDEFEELPTLALDKTPPEESSGLKYSIIAVISLILVIGGFMLWRKFKKPKEYVQLPPQNTN